MTLFWHRRDLRVADNRGLAAACRGVEPVVPVFVLDPDVLEFAGPPRVAFLLDALDSLRADYRDLGSDLLVVRGNPAGALPALADAAGVDRVVWNEDYSGLAAERDERVAAALDEAGVGRATHHDAVVHEPGAVRTTDGEPYSVYTPFWKRWRTREHDDPAPAPTAGDVATVEPGTVDLPEDVEVWADDLPSLDDLGVDEPEADVPPAGTDVARDLLAAFCDGPIYRYAESRDYPAREATSRLSPHLKFGTVGVREVWRATEAAMAEAGSDADRDGVETFQSQLAWREFYVQWLHFNQDAVEENYQEFERPIEWREDPEGLRAWKDGETGYPFVDAGMRQLRAEAYVHNRLRMVVASFLTKDLLVDWRAGYDWYREKLVDHDPANDAGGWQWAASTGTDAQPYFRVFNPVTQGERFDPDGEYVREYVPELRDATAEQIHGWVDLDDETREAVAPDYPAPIVDHAERREEAIAAFERARGDG